LKQFSDFFTCVGLLLLSSITVASAQEKFTVGVVPQYDARQLHSVWQPILHALGEMTGYELELMQSANIPEFESSFQSGNFDIVYLNPYHITVANKVQGYLPIVKDVSRSLRGIIVVKKNGGITTLDQLRGKQLALPAPNAFGASQLTRFELQNRHNIEMKSIFVGNHDSVYLNVVLGMTDAGGGVLRTLRQQSPKLQDALHILYETDAYPPHPIAVHPRMSDKAVERLKAAILELGDRQNGKELYAKVPISQVGLAKMKEYAKISSMRID